MIQRFPNGRADSFGHDSAWLDYGAFFSSLLGGGPDGGVWAFLTPVSYQVCSQNLISRSEMRPHKLCAEARRNKV
jgi:hypothetical protein